MATMYSDVEHVLMTGSLLVIMAASLVGNIMVCVTVYRKRRLRTRTNAFIINLALADLSVVTLCMPFSLITCLSHHWTLGDVICKLNGVVNIVFTQTSLLTLTAIAIDKYFAIVWPLRRVMTKRRTVGLVAWTWLQPVVIAAIPFAGILEYKFKPGTTQCGLEFPRTLYQSLYGVGVSIAGYFAPLGIMGYVYAKIFHSAKQSARRMSRVSINSTSSTNSFATHKKVALTVLILVLLFLGCWTPFFAYAMILISNPSLSSNRHVLALGKASYWMAFLCSALNPFIYGARNPQFRNEFKVLLCYLCPCLGPRLKVRGCSTTSGSRGSWEVREGSISPRRGSSPLESPYMATKRSPSLDLTLFLQSLAKSHATDNSESNTDESFNREISRSTTDTKQRRSSLQIRFEDNLGFLDSSRTSSHQDDLKSEQTIQRSSIHSNDKHVDGHSCNTDVKDYSSLTHTVTLSNRDLNDKILENSIEMTRYKCSWIESAL